MSQRSVWINGCSIAVLQEVCEEPHEEGVQTQPIGWVRSQQNCEWKVNHNFFHVDDYKISHKSTKVVDELIDWLRAEYESIFKDGSGEMKVHRGKVQSIWECLWTSHIRDSVVLPCMTIWMGP
jgi:hypothetical protein